MTTAKDQSRREDSVESLGKALKDSSKLPFEVDESVLVFDGIRSLADKYFNELWISKPSKGFTLFPLRQVTDDNFQSGQRCYESGI